MPGPPVRSSAIFPGTFRIHNLQATWSARPSHTAFRTSKTRAEFSATYVDPDIASKGELSWLAAHKEKGAPARGVAKPNYFQPARSIRGPI
jgi:hypothetical protein